MQKSEQKDTVLNSQRDSEEIDEDDLKVDNEIEDLVINPEQQENLHQLTKGLLKEPRNSSFEQKIVCAEKLVNPLSQ